MADRAQFSYEALYVLATDKAKAKLLAEGLYVIGAPPVAGSCSTGAEPTFDAETGQLSLSGNATSAGSGIHDHGFILSKTNPTPLLIIGDGWATNDFDGNWIPNEAAENFIINDRFPRSGGRCAAFNGRRDKTIPGPTLEKTVSISVMGPTTFTTYVTGSIYSRTLKCFLDGVEQKSFTGVTSSRAATVWTEWSVSIPAGVHTLAITFSGGYTTAGNSEDFCAFTDVSFSQNTFYESKISLGAKSGAGAFSGSIAASHSTKYYIRSFVRTAGGIAYGDVVEYTTGSSGSGFAHQVSGQTVAGIAAGGSLSTGAGIAGVAAGAALLT